MAVKVISWDYIQGSWKMNPNQFKSDSHIQMEITKKLQHLSSTMYLWSTRHPID